MDGIHIVRQGGGVRDYLFIQERFTIPTRHYLHSPEEDGLELLPFQLYIGDMPNVNIFLASLSERRVFYSRKNSTSILTQLKEVGPREAFLILCIHEYRPGNAGRHRSQFLSQFCVDGGRQSTPEISGLPEKHGRGRRSTPEGNYVPPEMYPANI
jgi:hypothetical protein